MKKIIVFLLSLTIALSPSIVWASAAEKWEYDVKPDTSQKLKVTGHKVDQFGDAVNDKKYTTTIDPKTTANKQKMGGVGIAKLLKKANWASVGVEAFQALLEGIDWVMDLEQQSIWRNKPNTQYGCVNYGHKWQQAGQQYTCPIDAAKALADSICTTYPDSRTNCQVSELYADQNRTKRLSQVSDFTGNRIYVEVSYTYIPTGTTSKYNGSILRGEKLQDLVQEREYLTPDAAADYANRTHHDFTNPHYKDRANPLYKPEIQENLWKPHNKWEEENSPTVQEVKKELEKANPDVKDDTIKENQNPETGEKSFSLPAFCSWATAVCEYFDWAKQEPELDNEEIEIQTPQEFDTSIFTKDRFQVSRQCPAPEQHTITLSGVSVSFSFDMTPLCTVLEMARPALVACSYLYAAYIVIGAARNG